MESSKGTLSGVVQVIGPDGKVKGEFKLEGQAVTAEYLNNGSVTRDSRTIRNSRRLRRPD